MLVNRKRYAGLLWTDARAPIRIDVKGLENTSRGSCGVLVDVLDELLRILLLQDGCDWRRTLATPARTGGHADRELNRGGQYDMCALGHGPAVRGGRGGGAVSHSMERSCRLPRLRLHWYDYERPRLERGGGPVADTRLVRARRRCPFCVRNVWNCSASQPLSVRRRP